MLNNMCNEMSTRIFIKKVIAEVQLETPIKKEVYDYYIFKTWFQ